MAKSATLDWMPLITLLQLAPGLDCRVQRKFGFYELYGFRRHIEDLNTILQCWPGVKLRENNEEFVSRYLGGLNLLPTAFDGLRIRKLMVCLPFGWGWQDSDDEEKDEEEGREPDPGLTFMFAKADRSKWMNGAILHSPVVGMCRLPWKTSCNTCVDICGGYSANIILEH
jgi:hypothetical protein